LATVSVLALTSASRSADMAGKSLAYVPAEIPTWAGLYAGIQGGVARHGASFNDLDCFFSSCQTFERSRTGATIGGLLGYNWQQSSFVYGLEVDWSWIDAKTNSSNTPAGGGFINATYDVNWLTTIRGRAGLAAEASYFYLTGGAVIAHAKDRLNQVFPTGRNLPPPTYSRDKINIGWTAGVGVEHMFSPHWVARAEFRYVDLGTRIVSCTISAECAGYRGEFSNTLMQGLVGLAYKF
jgi:outer membrane immunogenic protein